ncbi:MAG TPA: DUF262 domain-containing protein [Lichenihabitans sp.]|jgi:hypothetical protein|nr:DUF262 domain-containing protein [Lichenihabitans sp.]
MPESDPDVDVANAIEETRREVKYFASDYPIETLVRRFKEDDPGEGDIYIPGYQRTMQWNNDRKSYFIESCILRIPVPPIFFYEVGGRFEVVDGSQRIRTLVQFVDNRFVLDKLEKLDVLNGFRFRDLPPSVAKRLLNSSIRTFILEEGTDETTRVELFRRINTSSQALTDAEIRKGAYQGPFLDLVLDCANRQIFVDLAPGKSTRGNRDKESERQELVTRFFIYLNYLNEFSHDVRRFLDEHLKLLNRTLQAANIEEMSAEFDSVMAFIQTYMPRAFFRAENTQQVPRVRFEAVAVGSALAMRTGANLNTEDLSWLRGAEFQQHVRTDASNSGPKLRARVGFVRDKLIGAA